MEFRLDSLLTHYVDRFKYAKRFVKNDGIIEYFHFLRNKPQFYEKFDSIFSPNSYPSISFQHLQVPAVLQISKWTHYFEIYNQYLWEFRSKKNLKVLEIGVAGGGSLKMWRDYFNKDASIFGIDINVECLSIEDSGCEIRIGSQTDKDFLFSVVNEMGGIDVILDDGSHINSDVIQTFTFLYPLLNSGGVYLIEDTSTSYWPGLYKGGFQRKGTSIEFFKNLADLPNRFFYRRSRVKFSKFEDIDSIHFHPSIIVIQKQRRNSLYIWKNIA